MTTFLIMLVVAGEAVAPVITPWYFTPGAFALYGTIGGGLLLKAADWWFSKPDRLANARRDLNTENKDLLTRIDTLEQEVTDWREKFYAQQEQIAVLRQAIIKGGLDLPEK